MSELIDILNYYKTEIQPNTYIITSDNSLKIEFEIQEDNLCHLLFGTIEKGVTNRSAYIGMQGYKNIEDETITKATLPREIVKHARGRTDYFEQIHKLIAKPTGACFFNREIVQVGKHMKLNRTEIQGDFLIYKQTDTHLLHLILRNTPRRGVMVPVPNSFFIRKLTDAEPELFITNQKTFRILSSKKEKKSS